MTETTPALGLSAYFLGRRIAGQRKRMPVAYLYNGVRLPPLPEWDEDTYPYAFIGEYSYGSARFYRFCVFPVSLIVYKNGSVEAIGKPGVLTKYLLTEYANDVWGTFSDFYLAANNGLVFKPIWSNYDILNEDGTLHIKASAPIPVYE